MYEEANWMWCRMVIKGWCKRGDVHGVVCVQAGAESIMRNVAKRMLLADAAQGILEWRTKVTLDFNCQRGQIILKRVGGRWRNEELWGAYRNWKMKWREDADRERGEMIMRRVGARMMNKELAMTWDAWHRNCKEGLLQMVSGGMGAWM